MHPILFHLPGWLGGLPVFAYGSLLGVSLLLGWWLTRWLAMRDGISPRVILRVQSAAVVGAVVGMRLLFLLAYPAAWHGPASLFRLQQGGLVAYGGMLGGVLCAAVVCRSNRVSFWRFADHVAPSLAVGLGVTRIGCFLNGCCFGRVTDSFLGVCFPQASPAYAAHLESSLLAPSATVSLPVVPVQLLASLNGWLCLVLVLWVAARRTFRGQVFCALVLWYSATRFLLELLRDDAQRGSVGALSTSQLTSVLALSAALIGLWWLRARDRARA